MSLDPLFKIQVDCDASNPIIAKIAQNYLKVCSGGRLTMFIFKKKTSIFVVYSWFVGK